MDFNSDTIPVNFVGGSNAASFVIPTIDDSLVEGVENLFADIVLPPAAQDLGVTIGSPGTATVNINDNDGKCVWCVCSVCGVCVVCVVFVVCVVHVMCGVCNVCSVCV